MDNEGGVTCGDCLEVMKTMEAESIDLIVTDPPYGIGFMGKDWDRALPSVDIWSECLRVLRPGAFAFVMCIPRQDCLSRMIISLEDAGFMVNFSPIYWAYASGFPKAQNISKAVDKRLGAERKVVGERIAPDGKPYSERQPTQWTPQFSDNAVKDAPPPMITLPATPQAQALDGSYGGFQPKPAVEVILVAMKPLSEKTYVEQALSNGKGITWLDDGRIPYNGEVPNVGGRGKHGRGEGYGFEPMGDIEPNTSGRFPANLLVSDDVLNDGRVIKAGGSRTKEHGATGQIFVHGGECESYGDSGSFSRYFDLDKWAQKTFPFLIVPKASKAEKGKDNNHPTCKPIKLMAYLITLGSREGDVVLDPFAGSGPTGVACKELNRDCIMIEIDPDYVEIEKKRLEAAWI